jgi:phospholipid-binding lipoprotein MlaA
MKNIKWTAIILTFLLVQSYYILFVDSVEANPDYQNGFLNSAHEKAFLFEGELDIKAFSDPLGKDLNILIKVCCDSLSAGGETVIGKEILLADKELELVQVNEFGDKTRSADSTEPIEQDESEGLFEDEFSEDDLFEDDGYQDDIPDPLEPVNRFFFKFNDKLYFWVLRPVAKGYSAVIPSPARTGVRNFFGNLAFPIRFVNCILQGKIVRAGEELGLFVVNSTAGIAGILDYSDKFNYRKQEEDFGQTLGVVGIKPGFYIYWPFLGPSSLRDTVGIAGDIFLDPFRYITIGTAEYIAVRGIDLINETSFSIGDYEALVDAALDPYIAMRNAYHQYRESKINE